MHRYKTKAFATAALLGLSALSGCDGAQTDEATVATKAAKATKPGTVSWTAPKEEVARSIPSREAAPATAKSESPGSTSSVSAQPAKSKEVELSFDDLLDRADALAADGDIAGAIETYKTASKRDPQSAVPHVEIARLLIKSKQANRARRHAELAVGLSSDWSTAWNTLGRTELIAGKLDEAAEAFGKATEKNPANIYAWNNLGLVRLLQQHVEEAAQALEKATESDDAVAFMFNNLGTAYERLGRAAEALVAYKRALALGSSLAGKNFVRLENKQNLERRAQRPNPAPDPAHPAKPQTDPS